VAGAAVVAGGVFGGSLGFAFGFELFGGLEGAVGGAVGEQDFGVLAIDVGALGLTVGAEGAALVGTLVPGEAEPVEGIEDHLLGGGDEAGAVSVFDAENEFAAALASEDMVEKADVGGADMGVAGGRGSDADAGFGGGLCVCVGALGSGSSVAGRGRAFRDAGWDRGGVAKDLLDSHRPRMVIVLCSES